MPDDWKGVAIGSHKRLSLSLIRLANEEGARTDHTQRSGDCSATIVGDCLK